jgi:hypothetical protein
MERPVRGPRALTALTRLLTQGTANNLAAS